MKRLLVVAVAILLTTGATAADTGGFTFIKVSEGTTYANPDFPQARADAIAAGLLVGGMHFALPDRSTGAAQANHFVDSGGGWTADGDTLPGVVDLEYNPYGATCYGMTPTALVAWLRDFDRTYRLRTDRAPVIYTPPSWWRQCMGDSAEFARTNRLFATGDGLPGGWSTYTFRQTPTGDVFNGTTEELQAYALAE